MLLDNNFGTSNKLANVLIRNNPSGRSTVKGFSINHEYGLFYAVGSQAELGRLPHNETQKSRYGLRDNNGYYEWENFRKNGTDSDRGDRPKQFFPLLINETTQKLRIPELVWDEKTNSWEIKEAILDNERAIFPCNSGVEKVWKYGIERTKEILNDLLVKKTDDGYEIYRKKYFNENGSLPRTWWDKPSYSARDNGTRTLTDLFGSNREFDFPKAPEAVADSIRVENIWENDIVLDFFAGSGTTAHAVINLNREDGGRRKYILVEMGEYFDTVTKPRIQKVICSEDRKDGKPVSRKGSSHAFKYLRLESYEDTLNNIEIEEGTLKFLTNPAVKEQYMLHYLLPDETRGSASLLNNDMLEHPFDYAMNITRRQESKVTTIDLVETFNYLIGLKVERSYARQSFDADFTTGEYGAITARLKSGSTYQFKMVEGTTISGDRTLVIWRDLTGDKIKDNAVLEAFFARKKLSTTDFEYKKIYVNGDNNLPNLRADEESWKVVLIEEEMKKRMFSTENV
jgi:adenine-specific DNA-methyltransferase